MTPATFGLISGLLIVASYIPYTKDIFAGKVKPERASWLIWSVTGGIAFFTQVSSGATHSLWFPGLDCLGSMLVFYLSIKRGFGGLSRRDANALKFSGFSLILWVLSSNSIFALVIIMLIDGLGTVLTVWKTYENPKTETYTAWLILLLASAASMLAVGKNDIVLLAYPSYFFLGAFAVIAAIFFGRRVNGVPKTLGANVTPTIH